MTEEEFKIASTSLTLDGCFLSKRCHWPSSQNEQCSNQASNDIFLWSSSKGELYFTSCNKHSVKYSSLYKKVEFNEI